MILQPDFVDDDEGFHDYRPRGPKKQRIPPVVQLCKEMMPDIRTIGESIKAFDDDIKFLSEAISNEYGHEEYFNDALLQTLKSVIFEQPQKQPSIALLTMHVHKQNLVAGKSIINYFFDELQNLINKSIVLNEDEEIPSEDTGVWNKSKLILRFFALLSPLLIVDDLINLFKQFFDLAIELNKSDPSIRNPLSELIYTNTLINVPYMFYFNKSNEELKSKIENLIIDLENNFTINNIQLDLLNEYNSKNPPYKRQLLIELILPNVKRILSNDMQQLNELFIDWSHLDPNVSPDQGFNETLKLPTTEELLPFSKLDSDFIGSVDKMWKTPRYDFHVYLPNSVGDFSTMVPINTYPGQLFNDIIIDMVESMEFNRKEVARQVITLDLFFKPNLFAPPGESIAQLIETFEDNPLIPTFKIEDLAIETILGLLFKLPDLSQPFAYFYTLLVEICKNSPKAIAPVFGRAFRYFYSNLDSLDLELKLRYLDWFSVQMSNFNFSWKWNEWENDSIKFSKTFYNPKVSFARNLIQKELRLTSNSLDIEDSLPMEFKQYLDTSYIPKDQLLSYYQSLLFNYDLNDNDLKKNDLLFRQDSFPLCENVRKILDYIHKAINQKEVTELETLLEELKSDNLIVDYNKFIIILLIQSVVHSGSRSLSHANKYINDIKDDLQHIFNKIELDQEYKEQIIVEAILRFWNTNSQTGFLVADAFKHAGLISAKSIIKFTFTEFNNKNYSLSDDTAMNAIFRNLSQRVIGEVDSGSDFEYTFEQLCIILNKTVVELGVNLDQEIDDPIILEDTDLENDLPRFDLIWKYKTALSFIKSLLRKYSTEYKLLTEKFMSGMDNAITHEPTKQQIINWLNELSQI
ncbi:hypothetical protein TBLA_0H00330 [Henningerozyma blattae CBS 6284]|uniref:Nuclear cap-binding protein complex subunit 1 n=1 Tax=Henningerozyma blattae (strain ATCC 34711 / CBS 6284 / DSM 70876 / NBRC 10599 / NRRL Y-10934 / UCD 77-7) TaxID=1071380 RepID=I2H7H4_HENB6|nr:hypothetical protein TBLA_0H00330 [Tetrapisispora blattae CBS 6284]CCH62326.1 hypothetical protein TBLA_0H00330 [Tetrapisispora blattae CBS 6284]